MSDLFPVTLDDEIAEIKRELQMRLHVWGRGSEERFDDKQRRQWAVMQAVLQRLSMIRASR